MTEFPTHLSAQEPKPPTAIVRDLRHPAFRSSEKSVLYALASRMRKEQILIFAEMATIASDAGLDESAARRVMNWLVSVGVVVEVPDPTRRVKVRRIDFEALAALPSDVSRKTTGGSARGAQNAPTLAQRGGTPAQNAPSYTSVTPAQNAPGGAQRLPTPAQNPWDPRAAHPEEQGKSKEVQVKFNSARVPRRSNGHGGEVLTLDFGRSDTSTATTIPATATDRHGALGSSLDTLPVEPPNPSPKGTRKPAKKVAGKLTDEQAVAHVTTIDCWSDTYLETKGVRPILTGKDIKDIDGILALSGIGWDASKACALIRNAFTYVWFREKQCSPATILKQPSAYQVPAASERRISSGQIDPPDDFFAQQDERLAMEFGQ